MVDTELVSFLGLVPVEKSAGCCMLFRQSPVWNVPSEKGSFEALAPEVWKVDPR